MTRFRYDITTEGQEKTLHESLARTGRPLCRRRRQGLIEDGIVFVAILALVYAGLALRGNFTEGDTLYHFKVASLILKQGPWVDIRWLPFTVLGEHGPDHHWLWHVLLAPFALIEDPRQAILIASAVTCALVGLIASRAFRCLGIPWAPLFAILVLFAGSAMPERLTRLRAENLVYGVLLVAFVLMVRRRTLALFMISLFFMESYHGAVILLPIVLIHIVASARTPGPLPLGNAIAVLGGLTAGLAINPWFPANIAYFLFHTLFKLGSDNHFLTGGEWAKPAWGLILSMSWFVNSLLLAAIIGFFISRFRNARSVRLSDETVAALLMTLMALFLYHDAVRYSGYYALFGVLSAGLLCRDANFDFSRRAMIAARTAMLTLAVTLLWSGFQQIVKAPAQFPKLMHRYQNVTQYLARHASPDSVIFNASWSDFVLLFWQASQFRYVNGLDGNYLAYGDPERFKIWYAIDQMQSVSGSYSAVIRDRFHARWVLLPRSPAFDAVAMKIIDGGDAQSEYLDNEAWLIHLGVETAHPG